MPPSTSGMLVDGSRFPSLSYTSSECYPWSQGTEKQPPSGNVDRSGVWRVISNPLQTGVGGGQGWGEGGRAVEREPRQSPSVHHDRRATRFRVCPHNYALTTTPGGRQGQMNAGGEGHPRDQYKRVENKRAVTTHHLPPATITLTPPHPTTTHHHQPPTTSTSTITTIITTITPYHPSHPSPPPSLLPHHDPHLLTLPPTNPTTIRLPPPQRIGWPTSIALIQRRARIESRPQTTILKSIDRYHNTR